MATSVLHAGMLPSPDEVMKYMDGPTDASLCPKFEEEFAGERIQILRDGELWKAEALYTKATENWTDEYHDQEGIRQYCQSLKEHALKISTGDIPLEMVEES